MADASGVLLSLGKNQRVKRVTETGDPRLSSVMAGWDFAVVCAGIVVAGGDFFRSESLRALPTHGGKLYQLDIYFLSLSIVK